MTLPSRVTSSSSSGMSGPWAVVVLMRVVTRLPTMRAAAFVLAISAEVAYAMKLASMATIVAVSSMALMASEISISTRLTPRLLCLRIL